MVITLYQKSSNEFLLFYLVISSHVTLQLFSFFCRFKHPFENDISKQDSYANATNKKIFNPYVIAYKNMPEFVQTNPNINDDDYHLT